MCASKAIRLIVLAVVVTCSLAQNGGVFDSMMMGFSDAFGGSSGATSGSSVQMPITNGVNKKQTSFNPLGFGLNSLGRSKASNGVSGLMGSMGLADIAGNMETLQDMGSLTDNVASLSRDMTKVSLELEQSPQTIDMLLGSVDTSFDWEDYDPNSPKHRAAPPGVHSMPKGMVVPADIDPSIVASYQGPLSPEVLMMMSKMSPESRQTMFELLANSQANAEKKRKRIHRHDNDDDDDDEHDKKHDDDDDNASLMARPSFIWSTIMATVSVIFVTFWN